MDVFAQRSQVALICLALPVLLMVYPAPLAAPAQNVSPVPDVAGKSVVDNFEDDRAGDYPSNWFFVTRSKDLLAPSEALEEGEQFSVEEENGNRFVRIGTQGEAARFSVRNGEEFQWNLQKHPRLSWRWRALELPEGVSEKGQNDTGGALYVTFGSDWLGRPKSIKYTYSSALPVGTVVSFGPLKVIVADSALEPNTGNWKSVTRRIADDYRQVFGGDPPNRPLSITIWSDSDTTGSSALVDFDDITLLPSRR